MGPCVRFALVALAASACMTLAAAAQERDRVEDSRQVQVEPRRHLSDRSRVARREGQARRRAARSSRQFQGKLASSAATLADALDKHVRARQGAVAPLRLRQHAGRSGHARRDAPGHAAGDGAARRRRFSAEASFIEPEILKADKATIERFLAAEPRLKIYRVLPRGHRPPRARTRSATPRRSCSPTPGRSPGAVEQRLQHPRRTPTFRIRSVTLSDGRTVKLDQAALQRPARAAEPRRSREGDVGVLQGARRRSAARSARR